MAKKFITKNTKYSKLKAKFLFYLFNFFMIFVPFVVKRLWFRLVRVRSLIIYCVPLWRKKPFPV